MVTLPARDTHIFTVARCDVLPGMRWHHPRRRGCNDRTHKGAADQRGRGAAAIDGNSRKTGCRILTRRRYRLSDVAGARQTPEASDSRRCCGFPPKSVDLVPARHTGQGDFHHPALPIGSRKRVMGRVHWESAAAKGLDNTSTTPILCRGFGGSTLTRNTHIPSDAVGLQILGSSFRLANVQSSDQATNFPIESTAPNPEHED